MDYKKYENALEKAKVRYNEIKGTDCNEEKFLLELFPELKEDKDRIRKGLIKALSSVGKRNWGGIDVSESIAWLEKQDKQNPCESCEEARLNCQNFPCERKKNFDSANKVEPKFNFKVGQWIVTTGKCVYLIAKIDGFNVTLVDTNGNEYVFDASSLDDAHEWNIADAKNGDVLACKGNIKDSNGIKYERICLFNNLGNAFFTLTKTSNHIEEYDIDVNIDYPDNTVPATKEQKELLFMAMAGAGYTFDFKKKELKKIVQTPVEWHREDEQNLNACLGYIPDEFLRRWLMDAIHTKYDKLAWSEEDETRLTNIIIMLKEGASHHFIKDDITKAVDWLKSLKPQNHWKPTEEQVSTMKYLAKYYAKGCDEPTRSIIEGLYEQLKQL